MSWHNPFKSKKKTIVSSQIYNLAGDNREDFIKEVIFNGVYLENDPHLGEDIPKSILGSPAFKLRHYIFWLKNRTKGQRYQDIIGHYYIEFNNVLRYTTSVLSTEFLATLTIPEHYNVKIDHIEISGADYYFWGAKYLDEHYPQYLDDDHYDFIVDFSYKNNKTVTIHIYDITQPNPNYPGSSDDEFVEIRTLSFQATDYVKGVKCLYVAYQLYPLEPVENPVTHEVTYHEPQTITVPMTYFIYKNVAASHPDYDIRYASFFNQPSQAEQSTFLVPPIPFRLDNWQVSDAEKTNATDWELFQLSKLACSKTMGNNQQYMKISKGITDNESIGDIDYAYLMFGVSINTKDKAGKQYIYNFMQALYRKYISVTDPNDRFTEMYMSDMEGRSQFSLKITWKELFHDYEEQGTPRFTQMKRAFTGNDKYAIKIFTDTYEETIVNPENNQTTTITKSEKRVYFIYRRNKKATQYEWYSASGLEHHNYVHDGKTTDTEAIKAWDYEEVDGKEIYKESAFIFPIHEGIYKQLPAVQQAQISHSFAYLIFNSYVVKKVKWYQRGFFKVIVMVVIIIIMVIVTVFTAGSGTGPTAGMAGAIYGSLIGAGISATTALVITALVKAVVSMVVAAVVSKLTTKGLVALGLDKTIAAIAGAVAGIIAGYAAGGAFDPGSTTSTTSTTIETASETFTHTVTTVTPNTALQGATTAVSSTVYSVMTSPIKLLGLATSLFKTGTDAHFQAQAEKLQARQGEIEKLQKETALLQQELQEMESQFSEWAQKLTLWKLQTSVSPDTFFDITLVTGSELAERILRYPSIFLDTSPQLS